MPEEKKNLKALIILGNGFDLACGYRTKFDDFYNYVIEKEHNLNNFNFFIQLLRETFYRGENSAAMQKLLDINSKDNWMDIELLLNHFLFGRMYDYTLNIFNSLSPAGFRGTSYSYPSIVIHNWLSNCSINKKKGLNHFLMKHLKDFEDSLCRYLERDANATFYNKGRIDKLFNQLIEKVNSYKIINFNYMIPREENAPICFVHGSIYEQNIIVGVDSTVVQNKKLCEDKEMFTKTFRKMNLDLSTSELNKVLQKGIDKIVFYGHSLGQQDYSYFQSIFDFYDLYSSEVILEFCYSEYDTKRDQTEKDILVKRIYNLINLYGTTLDNKDHGRNMLHKLLLENRIIIREIVLPSTPITRAEHR